MRAWVRAAVGVLCAAGLTGCGIRSTSVPTDFGPAPSKAPCALSGPTVEAQPVQGLPVQVFLVCASQLVTVDRLVHIPSGNGSTDRVQVAQALIDQLAEKPAESESQAGYTSDVRGGMAVSGPRHGEPDGTLRLGTSPSRLGSYALAQVVCTLAMSSAADEDGTVILGGPGDEQLRRYHCTSQVRARPGSSEPSSAPVGKP
ncbi:hypothetical protein [Streptomyces sp. NPDC050560]|uniref:hypothetical protein n=1 Tax=Streptomyces sp. NPDC050560 TaxID=3365630 RepID=UPI0037AAD962